MEAALNNSIKAIIDFNDSINDQVMEICRPLFNCLGISYFEYDKITNDGKVFYICTNQDWLKFSLEEQMFDDTEHVYLCSLAKKYQKRYALWSNLKLDKTFLLSQYQQFDVWNGLTINEIESEAFNTYSFATSCGQVKLDEFYINNMPLFERFIVYFKQKLSSILDENHEKYLFSATPLDESVEIRHEDDQLHLEVDNFLKQTELDKFTVKVNQGLVQISKREFQCLQLLSQGKSVKEIGAALEISPRTVETYVNFLKNKTGLVYKNELIAFFQESPLRWYKYM